MGLAAALAAWYNKESRKEKVTAKLNDIQNLMREMNLTAEQYMEILDVV